MTEQTARDRKAFLSGKWTPEQYRHWIVKILDERPSSRKENRPAIIGYPVHDIVESRMFDVYPKLSQKGKVRFEEGYALAIEHTPEAYPVSIMLTALDMEVRKEKVTLVFPKTIPAIFRRIKEKGGVEEHLESSLRFFFEAMARTPSGYEAIKETFLKGELCVTKYFFAFFLALLETEPDNFMEYLEFTSSQLKSFFLQIKKKDDGVKISVYVASRVVEVTGMEKIRELFPEIKKDPNNKWFISGLLHENGPCELKDELPVLKEKKEKNTPQ